MFRTIVRSHPEAPLATSPLLRTGDRSRDTRERLLDAAERLFAERGFVGTSLRAVTRAAGASVSAANYHFGSKEALLHATLLRRVEPVNQRRSEALDAVEQGGGSVTLEGVLDAFLRPAVMARGESESGVRHVAARLYSDPPELVAELKRELFAPLIERFVAALGRALPGADRAELLLAFHLTVGVMVHAVAGHLDADEVGVDSDEALLRRMVAYAAAGIRASVREGAS